MALASAAGLSNVKKEIQSAPPNLASIVSCFHLAQQTTATATNANTSSIDGAYGSCNDILDELVPHLIWKVLVFRDAFPTFPNIPYAFVGNGATMSGTDEGWHLQVADNCCPPLIQRIVHLGHLDGVISCRFPWIMISGQDTWKVPASTDSHMWQSSSVCLDITVTCWDDGIELSPGVAGHNDFLWDKVGWVEPNPKLTHHCHICTAWKGFHECFCARASNGTQVVYLEKRGGKMLHDHKDDVVAMAHQVSFGHSNSSVLHNDSLCTLVRDDLDLEFRLISNSFHVTLTLVPDLVKGLQQNMNIWSQRWRQSYGRRVGNKLSQDQTHQLVDLFVHGSDLLAVALNELCPSSVHKQPQGRLAGWFWLALFFQQLNFVQEIRSESPTTL